jgi:hypothetical protein
MGIHKTHIYFVPGLAAGKEIFENITFPENNYKTHILEWIIPDKNNTLVDYAKKMAAKITEPNSVLIGVSFGGIVAQEMSFFLNLNKLIIISSIKTKFELPKKLKYANKIGAYRLVPTKALLNASDLTKFAMGPKTQKKLSLYQKYLSVRDKTYLDWAIYQLLSWKREKEVDGVIHIHGDKDIVFPIKNIQDCIVLKGGTHVMIMYKGKWLSSELIRIIEK